MNVVILVLLAVAAVAVFFAFKGGGGGSEPAKATSTPEPPPPERSTEKVHWLEALNGDAEGKTWHIGSRRVTIGRGPSNYVQVTDPNVSRTQAQLVPEGATLVLVDMTSSNGTRVNDDVVKRHVLQQDDVLKLGKEEFRYHLKGDFDSNAAWDPKAAGKEARNTTRALSGRDARAMVLAINLLEEHEGDVEAAAAAMGIGETDFKELLG